MIGAFVGLGLLLVGTIRYKDKKLAIIGVAGIVWSIILYGGLMLFATSRSGKADFKPFTQNDLNQLVAEIELYKLQRGHYPDSLKQLKSIDKFTPLNDPIQFRPGKSSFIYGRVGDKYYLFSSGLDGIPNTKDDLYPSIDIPDSTKIGLIRARNSTQ